MTDQPPGPPPERPKADVRPVDDDFLVAIHMDTGQALVPLADFSAKCREIEELKRQLAECRCERN